MTGHQPPNKWDRVAGQAATQQSVLLPPSGPRAVVPASAAPSTSLVLRISDNRVSVTVPSTTDPRVSIFSYLSGSFFILCFLGGFVISRLCTTRKAGPRLCPCLKHTVKDTFRIDIFKAPREQPAVSVGKQKASAYAYVVNTSSFRWRDVQQRYLA